MRVIAGLAALLALQPVACTRYAGPASAELSVEAVGASRVADSVAPITLARVGDAKIGEKFDPSVWRQQWNAGPLQGEVDCLHYTGGVLPDGVSMMVMDGAIARFELDARSRPDAARRVRAPFGLHLAMSRSELVEALPSSAEFSPHAYSAPQGEYLTWQDAESGLSVRVELTLDHIDDILWGDAGAVTLIEGCS